jgi:hypothetical protein
MFFGMQSLEAKEAELFVMHVLGLTVLFSIQVQILTCSWDQEPHLPWTSSSGVQGIRPT